MENILNDLQASEKYETDIFFRMARTMYNDCENQCSDLFDITIEKTNGFRNISPEVIIKDSRMIKVLRYCMLPVISQMKLGQLVDLSSTKDFEDEKVTSGNKYRQLCSIAPRLCQLFNEYIDWNRFRWLNEDLSSDQVVIAIDYAKKWTCSLIANQNSNTAFRNWRKELQETSAVNQAVRAGYTSVNTRRIVSNVTDILPGQYSRECRVQGRNVQKADIVIRLKNSNKLLLIEAKAIGVHIDAFKRIKECREKFDDWKQTFGDMVEVGVVLSGFVPEREYQSLIEEGAHVFWEHKENDLYEFIK